MEEHNLVDYWGKQKQLKKLVEKFEASKNEYMGGGFLVRSPPKPPIALFKRS